MKFVILIILMAFVCLAQFPDTFLGSVSVGQNPADVCISPDGTRAYAAVMFGFAAAIDVNGYSDFSLAGLVSIDGEPVTLECDPSGEYLYVADQENNLVHIISTEDLSITSSLQIQAEPSDMILYPAGNRIYLSHESGMVTAINTETQLVDNCFWVGENINSLCISPSGDLVFAADNGSPQEAVITTINGAVSHFNSGLDSYGCAVSGNGSRLFLSCPSWNLVGVVDVTELSPETTIDFPDGAPMKMVALPELPFVYGVSPSENQIAVIGTDDLTVKGNISLTGTPVSITVHPDGERLFIACSGDNKIKVLGFDPSGIDPVMATVTLRLQDSPSPAPSIRITGIESGPLTVNVFDVQGRLILAREENIALNESRQFDFDNLNPGVFIVTASMGNGISSVRMVVLEP